MNTGALKRALILLASGFAAGFLVVLTETELLRLLGLLAPLNDASILGVDTTMACLAGALSALVYLCTWSSSKRTAFAVMSVVLTVLFVAEIVAFSKSPGSRGYGAWVVLKVPQLFFGLLITALALKLRKVMDERFGGFRGSQ
jgi:hypothetical protein